MSVVRNIKCLDVLILVFSIFATNTQYPQNPAQSNQFGGWTFLPGGLLLQYGSVSSPEESGGYVTFPIPFTIAWYSITFSFSRTNSSSAQSIQINDATAPNRSYFYYTSSNDNNNNLYWMAIGK
jgi:hypothetical protein